MALLSWAVLSETLGQPTGHSSGGGDSTGSYAAAFGLFTMSMKIGLGLSAAVTGVWLAGTRQTSGLSATDFGPLGLVALLAAFAAAAIIVAEPGAAEARGFKSRMSMRP